MTAAVFFGCAFIAFGPALSLYVFTIATDPLRVIFLIAGNLSFHPVLSGSEESFSLSAVEVTWGSDTYSLAPTSTSILGLRMSVQATQSQVFFVDTLGIDWGAVQDESPNNTNILTSAFFWLVSLLLSSVFWFLVRVITDNRDGPVQNYLLIFGVLLSVCIQELFRLAYYRLLKKANEGLKSINPEETAPSMRLLAYVSGLGFGIMSGVFSFVNTLSNALGPGTVGIHGDSPQFFLNSAFMTLVIIMLHVFWGIVFFDGCEKNKWYILLTVLLTHLLVSTQTLLSPHYEVNLVTAYIIMVLMGIWAFCVAGGSRRSLKLCLLCQDKDFLLYNQRSR